MSDSIMTKVWELDFPDPTLKFVCLALARHTIRNGVCWAAQKTIAAETGFHYKTVGRAISNLEEMGYLTRHARFRGLGGRTTDKIWLTLPQVVLQAEVADEGSADDSPPSERDDFEKRSRVSTKGNRALRGVAQSDPGPGAPDSTMKGESKGESKGEDARERDARSEADQVNLPLAVQLIWQAFSQAGRNRSSLGDVKDELERAIRRRPPGETAETRLERVMGGLKAYLATPDARKDLGAFQRGPHRLLIKDRWESYLTDGDGRLEEDQPPVDPEMGTSEKPGPKLQRFWAELAQQGMPWDSSRGPRPGMPGCRISPEIQREFGFTPWSPPPAEDDDGSAFA